MASLEGLGWRWRDADEVWVVSDRDWDGLIVGPTRIEPDDVPSEALELEPLIAWHVELSCDAGDAGERRAARRVLAAARLLAGDGGGSIGDDSSLLFDPQTQTHVVHAKFASHLGDRLARATPQRHRVPPELIRITTLPRTTRSHPNILLHLQLGGVRPSGGGSAYRFGRRYVPHEPAKRVIGISTRSKRLIGIWTTSEWSGNPNCVQPSAPNRTRS